MTAKSIKPCIITFLQVNGGVLTGIDPVNTMQSPAAHAVELSVDLVRTRASRSRPVPGGSPQATVGECRGWNQQAEA